MNIIEKIDAARKKIKSSDLKKQGRNKHSNYDYYTPEQINHLVNAVCSELRIFNSYELKRNEIGLYAELTVINLDDLKDFKTYTFATDIPQITATNVAQQIGGCMTYSERYALMFIYDIKDNNLDYDAQSPVDNKPDKSQKQSNNQSNFETREVTKSEVDSKWNGKLYKGNAVYIDNIKIVIPQDQYEKLKTHPKYKQ